MFYLIYSSKATQEWSSQDFVDLLSKCRKNNHQKNITGMLLYSKGRFMQVLEGEKQDVLDLYEIISEDPRHEKLFTVLKGSLDKRNFSNWSMGFKRLEQSELYELGSVTELESLFEADDVNNSSHPAMIFLKLFYDKNIKDDLVDA